MHRPSFAAFLAASALAAAGAGIVLPAGSAFDTGGARTPAVTAADLLSTAPSAAGPDTGLPPTARATPDAMNTDYAAPRGVVDPPAGHVRRPDVPDGTPERDAATAVDPAH